jgi:release factor glutamine methyltransferase
MASEFEAEILIAHITGLTRAGIHAHPERELTAAEEARYRALLERLSAGEPLQYLTGKMEFYGLEFEVNPSVLVPRPETEIMAERALNIAKGYDRPAIADIGCGSGALAVTLAVRLPRSTVTAADISPTALETARRNAVRHHVANIGFRKSELLSGLTDLNFDIICANLPYVPSAEVSANRFEPRLALDGGTDGLDLIRRLLAQIAGLPRRPDWLLLEFGTGQAAGVKRLIAEHLPHSRTEILTDLIPLERVSVTRLS